MTVAELIEKLKKMPRDAEVWIDDSDWGYSEIETIMNEEEYIIIKSEFS